MPAELDCLGNGRLVIMCGWHVAFSVLQTLYRCILLQYTSIKSMWHQGNNVICVQCWNVCVSGRLHWTMLWGLSGSCAVTQVRLVLVHREDLETSEVAMLCMCHNCCPWEAVHCFPRPAGPPAEHFSQLCCLLDRAPEGLGCLLVEPALGGKHTTTQGKWCFDLLGRSSFSRSHSWTDRVACGLFF